MRKVNYKVDSNNIVISWREIPFNFNEPYIEIDDNIDIHIGIDEIIDGKLIRHTRKYNNRKKIAIERESIVNSIYTYKKMLSDSDYKALKFFEGELSEEEYLPIKQQRSEWRKLINELEVRLIELNDSLLN